MRCSNMDIKEHSIVIIEDSAKEEFIRTYRQDKPLFDISILGLNEFKKKYYFDYTKEAVYYVHKKYSVIKDIAEIYIENLYYLTQDSKNPKLSFLEGLKKDLDERNLLIYDEDFKNSLKGKEIVLYDLKYVDAFYNRIWKDLKKTSKVRDLDKELGITTKKPLFKLPNRDMEIAFVATKIAELLKVGIPLNKIKLANVSEEYTYTIKRTFKDFHIPVCLPPTSTIKSSKIVSEFEKAYGSDIERSLENIKSLINGKDDEYVYQKILGVLNKYTWCRDYLDVKAFVFADLAKIKIKSTLLKQAVRVIDFTTYEIKDDDFVFLVNFNAGVIPVNKKDEDYLNDTIKRQIGISDSVDANKKMTERIRNRIMYSKNLTVTYSTRDLSSELYISNAYDESLFEESTPTFSFEHSDGYNKKVLLKARDENKKYGTTSDELKMLISHYPDEPYDTYDNSFKGIDNNKLKEYLQNKLTLSYSSMNDFYKCSFKYYLSYILKLDNFEDSFATATGSIFHEVLSKCFTESFDFQSAWETAIEHQNFEFKEMEKFYLELLKEELLFIISNIKDQLNYTGLDSALFEQKITVPLDENGDIIFKGFVDKILYNSQGETKVAAIIDYKTGHPKLNLDGLIHGLDMQLPIYAFLLKNFESFKDVSIGGFYLQQILNNEKDPIKKANALKLQGYSNSNPRILKVVDKTYEDSQIIKSLKMGKDKFYNYAKVLGDKEIDEMIHIVEEKIRDAAREILKGNFTVDPKEIEGDNVGCLYCHYKDICYVKNKDIKKLPKRKKEEFLGGDEDGLD